MQPVDNFTVGNTITVAVAIYRNNLKKFLQLSLAAHLWLLVPIYGWARYFAIAAWISRLGFDALTNEVNNSEKQRYFKPHSLFTFLVSGLTSIIVPVILGYLFTAIIFILIEAVRKISSFYPEYDLFEQSNATYPLISIIIFLVFILFTSWFYTKLFVSDLMRMNTNKLHILYLVNQSLRLIKSRKIKTFKIIFLSFVISFPVWASGFFVYIALIAIFATSSKIFSLTIISNNKDFVITVCFCLSLLGAHSLLVPFWQSVKAVTFYQLTDLDRKYSLR